MENERGELVDRKDAHNLLELGHGISPCDCLGLALHVEQSLTCHSLRPPQMRKTAPPDMTLRSRY